MYTHIYIYIHICNIHFRYNVHNWSIIGLALIGVRFAGASLCGDHFGTLVTVQHFFFGVRLSKLDSMLRRSVLPYINTHAYIMI